MGSRDGECAGGDVVKTPTEVITEYMVAIRAPSGPEYRDMQEAVRIVASVEVEGMTRALTDAGWSIVSTEDWLRVKDRHPFKRPALSEETQ